MDDPPVGPAPRIDDYRAWQESLDENSVRWVVVWVPWWEETGSPVAETWVANHPERFELVRDFEGRARVYRTTPPGGVHFPEDRG
jgi:hypothetical protein